MFLVKGITEDNEIIIDNFKDMSDQENQNTSNEPVKIYLGNLQEKTRPSGDKFLTGSICLDDLDNVHPEHIQIRKNKKRYIRIVINPYKDGPNEYGNTHSVAIDTFKPNKDKK